MTRSRALRAALALAACAAAPAGAPPPGPHGTFVVAAAHRDAAVSNPQALYMEDDPRLVGRIVSFDGGAASFDGDDARCDAIVPTTITGTAGRLFAAIMPGRSSPNHASHPGPADFRLPIAATAHIRAVRYRCTHAGRNGAAWDRAAAFPLGPGRWALAWPESFALVLQAVPPDAPIAASFPCDRAASPGERAICGDRQLAGWDRSVAAAYRAALDGSNDPDALTAAQKAWLAIRARCGAARACLLEAMRARTAELTQG